MDDSEMAFAVLEHHARGAGTEISRVEAAGAINFLAVPGPR